MSLTEYLVPSRTRRAVLRELSAARGGISVRALAKRARVAYSNAHREIRLLEQTGLMRRTGSGPSSACRLDPSGAAGRALCGLFAGAGVRGPLRKALASFDAVSDEEVLGNLRRHGAPLVVPDGGTVKLGLEETLALALGLARRRPDVARVLPLVLHANRAVVDLPALEALAVRLGRRRVLGFFLELTRRLTGDAGLDPAVDRLRDGRVRRFDYFFTLDRGKRAMDLARRRTPEVAKSWRFWMNAPLESFRDCFRKHRYVVG